MKQLDAFYSVMVESYQPQERNYPQQMMGPDEIQGVIEVENRLANEIYSQMKLLEINSIAYFFENVPEPDMTGYHFQPFPGHEQAMNRFKQGMQ